MFTERRPVKRELLERRFETVLWYMFPIQPAIGFASLQ